MKIYPVVYIHILIYVPFLVHLFQQLWELQHFL